MQSQVKDDLVINDVEPKLVRNWADLIYSIASAGVATAVVLFATCFSGTTAGVEHDAKNAGKIIEWIVKGLPSSLFQQALTIAIVAGVIVSMIDSKKWINTAISTITLLLTYPLVWYISYILTTLNNPSIFASFNSISNSHGTELLPDMYAVLVAFLTVSGPRRDNKIVKLSWQALLIASPILIVTSWHSLTGALTSWCIGRSFGTLIRFIKGTQSKGAWGKDIVEALENIGITHLVQLNRRTLTTDHSGVLKSSLDDDLIENSRLYDAIDIHGTRYVISVLDNQVHLPGYLNQLWQWVKLIDIPVRRDRSARHSIHHHLSMLLALRNLHLATANVYGVTDLEKSSIMVFHTSNVLVPCNLNTLTAKDAQRLMQYLDIANSRGITHRRIGPESLARLEDGTPLIAGWQNGDVASDSTNIALDKVQLLTIIASCIDAKTAVESAINVWGEYKVAQILPFIQKAAVPASVRSLSSCNKKLFEDLKNEISKKVCALNNEEDYDTVRLARFNIRFFVSLILIIAAISAIVTQLHPQEFIFALKKADSVMVVACFACSMLAWVGSSITLGSFMDDSKPNACVLFTSQAASGFTAVSMPAGVGPAFVNMQLIKKNGSSTSQATAITSAVWLLQSLVTALVIFSVGIFTGKNLLSGMIPTHMLITVIGIVTIILCAFMAITPIRKFIRKKYLPILSDYGKQIKELVTKPKQLFNGTLGGLILVFATGLGYWVALLAFGYYANPWETVLLFLVANTAGSAVPTPGGLGAVEASLTFAFTSVGVPPTIALSATLLYRLMFYWLRIPIGAFAMKSLSNKGLI